MSADKTAKLKRFSSFELGDHRAECEDGSVQFENDILIEPHRLIKPDQDRPRWFTSQDREATQTGEVNSKRPNLKRYEKRKHKAQTDKSTPARDIQL